MGDQGEEEDEMMKGTMTTIRCACAGHEVIAVVRGLPRPVHERFISHRWTAAVQLTQNIRAYSDSPAL